jgi:alanyl-tRNA synthetase
LSKPRIGTQGAALRQHFLEYFGGVGHTQVPSAPLVPQNDPSLMFVNAGMVPFKDYFSGAARAPMPRAVSCQKCLRVSGKHNDLDEVGRTARHHTFFEMLGNFSFGDYFKEQAIQYAWRFIRQELNLNPDRLWITVFGGAAGVPADSEARRLWKTISGLPEDRILDMGAADNFWQMGDRGPCGPCTEIHYDQGQGPVAPEDFASGRIMEIWNNVFMQFDRQADGNLVALPAPCVDTGMGLERVASLLQGEDSNYHSDLFLPLLQIMENGCGKAYGRSDQADDVSMRILADHARSTAFLLADGVVPSNEGHGYVLRRLMRRAIRQGRRLGADDGLLADACAGVVQTMGTAYPELPAAKERIDQLARGEAEAFSRTLDTGLKHFAEARDALRASGSQRLSGTTLFRLYDTYGFPPDLTAILADEQGLQLDMEGFDAAMAAQQERSRGSSVGDAAVQSHYQAIARDLGAVPFVGGLHEGEPLSGRPGRWREHTEDGILYLQAEVVVAALLRDGSRSAELSHPGGGAPEQAIEVVLQPNPFYGEGGGQCGDTGRLSAPGLDARVVDSQRPLPELTVCRVRLGGGSLRVGERLWAGYEVVRRQQIRAHHSATHLLHGALRAVLGKHVGQAGSFVGPDSLRFDFSHPGSLSPAQRLAVEAHANARIFPSTEARCIEVSQQQAREMEAIAMFGEKYGERVRVMTLADSVELCGGTHVRATGEIDLLLILSEQAVQSGVRRIEARVGRAARHTVRQLADLLEAAKARLHGLPTAWPPSSALTAEAQLVVERVERLAPPTAADASAAEAPKVAGMPPTAPLLPADFGLSEARQVLTLWAALQAISQAKPSDLAPILAEFAEVPQAAILRLLADAMQQQRARSQGAEADADRQLVEVADRLHRAREQLGSVSVVCAQVDAVPAAGLRRLADLLRERLGSGAVVLARVEGSKVSLLVGLTADLIPPLQAGKLIREAAPLLGGRGGGRPELAAAGGDNPAGLPAAMAQLKQRIAAALP